MTVDGLPLRMRSNLSGNATTAFDWGYVGTGQLSLVLLTRFLGDDRTAGALAHAFEKQVVAHLPHDSWTLTDHDLAAAVGEAEPERVSGGGRGCGRGLRHMPVDTAGLATPWRPK